MEVYEERSFKEYVPDNWRLTHVSPGWTTLALSALIALLPISPVMASDGTIEFFSRPAWLMTMMGLVVVTGVINAWPRGQITNNALIKRSS